MKRTQYKRGGGAVERECGLQMTERPHLSARFYRGGGDGPSDWEAVPVQTRREEKRPRWLPCLPAQQSPTCLPNLLPPQAKRSSPADLLAAYRLFLHSFPGSRPW